MIATGPRNPMILAALLALGVNIFLFALLPGMRTAPTRSDETFRLRPVTMVKLKELTPPPPAKAPEKPVKQEKPMKPRLDLPIDPTPVHTAAAPTLKVGEALPELDTTAFKPGPVDMVFGEAQLDKLPMPSHNVAPIYPFRAKRLGISGSVTVKFLVEKDGRIHDVEITGSNPPGVFDRAVMDAIGRWTFTPGEITGEPVRVRVTKTINFNLEN
ncbi:energy transducer TonB [Desulfoluna butyratoxydans]|uniref:Tonb c-terminal n=1 Tax=Desulfoluna butyratoxydans TaxID=231438 RepID=A0A4U8YQY9_9BACT|nr:energy transducer TonB [Desulfoluna butyratoxydans]VFQ46291.1 tonb c-terminal [Desulfoluna butyratoxydans]